jgi:hypothetical protein
MSLLFALLLAAGPAPATNEVADKKPRKKCEYVSEVGSNRPRRVCQIINAPALAKPVEQGAVEAAKTTTDHSQNENQSGSNE